MIRTDSPVYCTANSVKYKVPRYLNERGSEVRGVRSRGIRCYNAIIPLIRFHVSRASGFHDFTISGILLLASLSEGQSHDSKCGFPAFAFSLIFPHFAISTIQKVPLIWCTYTQGTLPPYLSYALLCRRFSLDHFIDRTCLCTASLPCVPGGKRTKQLCYFLFPISYLLFLVLFAETLLIFTYLLS